MNVLQLSRARNKHKKINTTYIIKYTIYPLAAVTTISKTPGRGGDVVPRAKKLPPPPRHIIRLPLSPYAPALTHTRCRHTRAIHSHKQQAARARDCPAAGPSRTQDPHPRAVRVIMDRTRAPLCTVRMHTPVEITDGMIKNAKHAGATRTTYILYRYNEI